MSGCNLKIYSQEAAWASGEKTEGGGGSGHRPTVRGDTSVPPVDSLHDIRSAMVLTLESIGCPVEVHHHEVATAGQCEIGTVFDTLVKRADQTQILKYVVHNVAHQYGKTATFMPKPIVGDNGSGMHVHQSIWKDGKNLFAGNGYAGLSETALYYIGGIIKHAKALNAITNPGTNSYKRLVPHCNAGQAGLFGQESLGFYPRAACGLRQGAPYRDTLPRPDCQSLSVLCRADDGRSGWYPEQDPPRSGRQEPLRSAAGRRGTYPRPFVPAWKKRWKHSTRIATS